MKNPCTQCRRVRCPEQCENKNCIDWQTWFSYRWDRICALLGGG